MPMKIPKELVKHVALLSRLELDERELALYSAQLESILEYIGKLKALDTEGVQPTSHAIASLKNVYRRDEPRPSLGVTDVLGNAPAKENGFFKIPKVIEDKAR